MPFKVRCDHRITQRGVAQFGRALRLGRRGPRFKSGHPDHNWLRFDQCVLRFLTSGPATVSDFSMCHDHERKSHNAQDHSIINRREGGLYQQESVACYTTPHRGMSAGEIGNTRYRAAGCNGKQSEHRHRRYRDAYQGG